METLDLEKVGDNFDLKTYLHAREVCIDITEEIIRRVEPGMNERAGQELVKDVFQEKGIRKFWHGTKFRVDRDTLKDFSEKPEDGLVSKEGDLCFVDIGPIIDDYEADFGRTFVVGGKGPKAHHDLITATEEVFKLSAEAWKRRNLTGVGLLEFGEQEAIKRGYKLNPKMAGHRLSEFPHRVYTKKSLFSFKKVPKAHVWVLETHLWDEKIQRGAFYEDILF